MSYDSSSSVHYPTASHTHLTANCTRHFEAALLAKHNNIGRRCSCWLLKRGGGGRPHGRRCHGQATSRQIPGRYDEQFYLIGASA